MYENFGDIGMNIKKMVDDFQQIAKSNQKIQTIGMCCWEVSDLLLDDTVALTYLSYFILEHLRVTLTVHLSFFRRYGQVC